MSTTENLKRESLINLALLLLCSESLLYLLKPISTSTFIKAFVQSLQLVHFQWCWRVLLAGSVALLCTGKAYLIYGAGASSAEMIDRYSTKRLRLGFWFAKAVLEQRRKRRIICLEINRRSRRN